MTAEEQNKAFCAAMDNLLALIDEREKEVDAKITARIYDDVDEPQYYCEKFYKGLRGTCVNLRAVGTTFFNHQPLNIDHFRGCLADLEWTGKQVAGGAIELDEYSGYFDEPLF